MRNLIGAGLALCLLSLAACNLPDPRPAQRAECDLLGGTYRVDPEGASEDECAVPTRNGQTFVIEYDEIHTPSGGSETIDD